MSVRTGRWVLHRPVTGALEESHFRWEEVALSPPGPGQLLVRHLYLSLDPGNRIWMSDRDWLRELDPKLKPIQPGETLKGATISIVEESGDSAFARGDIVQPALSDWSERQVVEASATYHVDVQPGIALPTYLESLGHTGLTAYMGVVEVLRLRAGEILLVSGASGAVGRAVGEIARHLGAYAIGLTGGPAKVAALVASDSFDQVLDASSGDLGEQLAALSPAGIDALFENVGGRLLDIGLGALKSHGRAAICGIADCYDRATPPSGPSPFPAILMRRLAVTGFGVFDFPPEAHQSARAMLMDLFQAGRLTNQVTLISDLRAAPAGFLRLLTGQNSGKTVVELAPR